MFAEIRVVLALFEEKLESHMACSAWAKMQDERTVVLNPSKICTVPYEWCEATTAMSVSHTRQVMAGILYNQEVCHRNLIRPQDIGRLEPTV
eukprot:4370191-Amphidinium_carterae.1